MEQEEIQAIKNAVDGAFDMSLIEDLLPHLLFIEVTIKAAAGRGNQVEAAFFFDEAGANEEYERRVKAKYPDVVSESGPVPLIAQDANETEEDAGPVGHGPFLMGPVTKEA